jgi:hypothetical protein
MTAFTALKLTAAKKPTQIPAVQVRRNKLTTRIGEQIELARAQQGGMKFTVTKLRTFKDKETGLRRQIEVDKQPQKWWFMGDNGKLAISIRYGAKVLELAKGRFAVELATEKDLVPTLEIIKAAVSAGELDVAIEAASHKMRDGFGK